MTDPFVAVPVLGRPGETGEAGASAVVAAERGVFAATDHPLVYVSSLSRSRRGHDLVVYLRSVADEDVDVTVSLPWAPAAAFAGTSLERDLEAVPTDGASARVRVPACGYVALVADAGSA